MPSRSPRAAGPKTFPAVELAQEGHAAGNPAAPLVKRLRAAVGEPAASSVHLGSTSQDVVDTAAMLVAARTIDLILEDLGAVADETAALARDTPLDADRGPDASPAGGADDVRRQVRRLARRGSRGEVGACAHPRRATRRSAGRSSGNARPARAGRRPRPGARRSDGSGSPSLSSRGTRTGRGSPRSVRRSRSSRE